MSPISINIFRKIKTQLELDPPVLSFSSQPTSQSNDPGESVTFTGTAIASGDGTISYQWYENGTALSDGGRISGSSTNSLTITDLQSPSDNGRSFVLRATYVPGATSGNATNSPLDSNAVSLTVWPSLSITTQPTDQTTAVDTTATFSVVASISDSSYGSIKYLWTRDGTTIQNSTSNSVTIVDTTDGRKQVVSNTAILTGVFIRNILSIEAFKSSGTDISTSEVDFDPEGTEFTLDRNTFGSDYSIIQFYAKEKDLTVDLTMRGAAGNGRSDLNFSPGEGGVSTIRFTMQKDVEYTLLGISPSSALFLYRGSNLIAVVGQGGDRNNSPDGNGGDGGGVNISGGDGSRKSNFFFSRYSTNYRAGGGSLIPPGNLSLNGIWGSNSGFSQNNLQPGDTIASLLPSTDDSPSTSNGGRTISCTKGTYWLNQGISPCSNNSSSKIKYRDINGNEVSGSSSLTRGFKPGYTITNTAGRKRRTSGGWSFTTIGSNGGNGATGGEGSQYGTGGGGGSGYTNGEVDIIETRQGGNPSTTSSVTFTILEENK
jgi:hypothetical protein